MRKSYFNFETRIALLSDLSTVSGKKGKRVFVEENNKFYYWDNEWILESGVEYKYYSCQLFQFGSSSAYDNVMGNHTLSDYITWERLATGVYRGTLEGAFPEQKTQLFHSGIYKRTSGSLNTSPPGSNSITFVTAEIIDEDTIMIYLIDSETMTEVDGLNKYDLEIRVYSSNVYRD